jgi:hypothetical protein
MSSVYLYKIQNQEKVIFFRNFTSTDVYCYHMIMLSQADTLLLLSRENEKPPETGILLLILEK